MNKAFVHYCLLVTVLFFSYSCKQRKASVVTDSDPVFQNTAVKEISEKISGDPKNARLYYERGVLLHKLEADTFALNDFKKAVTLDSTKAEYFSAVGDLMFDHKDIAGSVPWIEKAVQLNPNDPIAHLKIAKMLVFMKDYSKAFAEINAVLRQNAMMPEGYFLKGIIYKDLKDTVKAISSFQTALQVAPDYKEAVIQLGSIYSAKRDPVALKYYDNAYKLDTLDVFPLYARGMFYQEQEKYEQAKHEYRNCIKHNPDYTNAYFSMGWILMQEDSLDKAWRQFDLVTKLEPTYEKAYYNRGLCSELMGDREEAILDYKQALTFNEQYKEAAEGLKRLGGK